MNKQVIEKAIAQACEDVATAEIWAIDGRISEAEGEEDKTFPALSVEVENIQPVAGNGNYGTVIVSLLIESQVETPDSAAAARHAARVEDLCGKLDQDFLTAINDHASGAFECLGFAEQPPLYGIEGRIWAAAVKMACGIIWIRTSPILDEFGEAVTDSGEAITG